MGSAFSFANYPYMGRATAEGTEFSHQYFVRISRDEKVRKIAGRGIRLGDPNGTARPLF